MQVEQNASTSCKKKEKAQINLDNESTTSALKKLHKLQMKELKQNHTVERNQLKSALAKWENGVSHHIIACCREGNLLFVAHHCYALLFSIL